MEISAKKRVASPSLSYLHVLKNPSWIMDRRSWIDFEAQGM